MNKGSIFIISGPSGSGKSTILDAVFTAFPEMFFSISATTRQPRNGEIDGVDYHFISKEQFSEMLDDNAFLEHAEYVGNFYGTPAKPVFDHVENGKDVIIEVEVQGYDQLRKKLPEATSIFIMPPSLEELENRLRGRFTESEEKIRGRLAKAASEIEFSKYYDEIVVNDVLSQATEKVIDIIKSKHIYE